MALITRISRLFTADFHAVLDRLEEPDVLLKQAIREMEEELARCEQHRQGLEREHAKLARQETDIATLIARLDGELDLCFGQGEEALARAVVKRKLVQSHLHQAVRGKHEGVAKEIDTTRARLAENRERLADLRQKAELVCDHATPTSHEASPAAEPAITEAEIDVAFLKERQQRRRS